MKDKARYFLRMLKGMLIGAAGIIPGASGGIIAVAMGEYQPAVEAVYDLIRHPRRNFKSSVRFLFPLGTGVVAGILGCSFLLEYLLLHYEEPLMFALIGMVIGGIPSLLREGNAEAGFKPRYLLLVLAGGLAVSLLALLDGCLTGGGSWPLNGYTAMLGGGIIVIGIVIPGISTSFILMYMGLYAPLLSALTGFNLPILFCMGLGALVVGGALFLFVRRMFHRHSAYTHYAILGFLLGTTYLIFPGFSAGKVLSDVILLILGLLFTLFSTRRSDK